MSVIDEAITRYKPVAVFAMFSGGHDSLIASHIAAQHPRFSGVVHINTGTGIEETRQFVMGTCEQFGWPVKEYHPPVPYEQIVKRWGFPGPGTHSLIYARLKERCIRQLVREAKTKASDKVLLITGVRRQESTRRMGYTDPIQKDGARIWVAPILQFTNADKDAYIIEHNLPRNIVVERLCLSGECLCGAFAKPGELEKIRHYYPAAAKRIDRWSEMAFKCGVHSTWGTNEPKAYEYERKGQMKFMPLCVGCESKFEAKSLP